jgi:hypothetical protein
MLALPIKIEEQVSNNQQLHNEITLIFIFSDL